MSMFRVLKDVNKGILSINKNEIVKHKEKWIF